MAIEKVSVTHSFSGVGISLLGVVFVTLKLLGITAVAGWSWWWVTAPFWGGIALLLAIMAIAMLVIFVVELRK